MKIGIQLLKLMEKKAFSTYPEDFISVNQQEILDFIQQYDIPLRNDHLQFMMKYGNSLMFREDHGEVSFQDFKEYFIEQEKDEGLRLCNLAQVAPIGSVYFGFYDMGALNIRNDIGDLCEYSENNGYYFNYLNINSVLVERFLSMFRRYPFFKNVEEKRIPKVEIDLFCEENKAYKISDLDTWSGGFYYKDGDLIRVRRSSAMNIIYSGGILDELEKNI